MFVSPLLYIIVKSLYFFFYYIYIYIYSNDEIEKEIRCCITKGEQTLFAQISCNTLIIMIIIGRTLIFLFAIVRCLFAVSTRIFLFLSHPWQRKHLQMYSNCHNVWIESFNTILSQLQPSWNHTHIRRVLRYAMKIKKSAKIQVMGRTFGKICVILQGTSTWSRRVIRCL